jgi:hypothetical protein
LCSKPGCRLEHWSLRISPFPRDHGAIVLTGRAFGHPDFADGTAIITSPLRLIVHTETADLAYTNTTVYELSAADPDLITVFLDEN